MCTGCRATVPIHTWVPSKTHAPVGAKIALAPVSSAPAAGSTVDTAMLASQIEQALLAQRPVARADVALFTSDQLAQRSPIRLASTRALQSDLTAIQAARAIKADILLQGTIVSADLVSVDQLDSKPQQSTNFNELFFQRRDDSDEKDESLLISWRVLDAESGRTLDAQSTTLRTQEIEEQYPDLRMLHSDNRDMLAAATAREAWKLLSPVVVKDEVRLSVPWLQPGAWTVRRGVAAAKKGKWQLAEERWQKAATRYPFSAAAHHNLAIAMAAREDFHGAKEQLQSAVGPLAIRLPTESLFWLDQRHRRYHEAHGLAKPTAGWAFPDPIAGQALQAAEPINLDDLPWWTAIPFAKPPNWSWHDWLTQPFVL